jgi:hypothetical protein
MINKEDAKKLNRIKELEEDLSFTRFAIPLAFIFTGFIFLPKFINGEINVITFSQVIIAPIMGLIFFAIELSRRRNAKEELILLKWELGLK